MNSQKLLSGKVVTNHSRPTIPKFLIPAGISFLILIALSGYFMFRSTHHDKDAIELVFKQYHDLWGQTEAKFPPGTSTHVVVQWLCDVQAKIDLSSCPADFSEAFLRHEQAWHDFLSSSDQLSDSFMGQVWQGFMNSLGGEMDGGAHRIQGQIRESWGNVDKTWTEVKIVATRYKVRPPPSPAD